MTMDKFSELKAAAEKYSVALNAHRENPTDKGALYAWDEATTVFFRAISNREMEIIIALLAELEASNQYAKERDAENESLALTVGRLRVELHNEGAANAHAYERIRGLEKRLATPVQLPVPYSENPWMSPDPDGTWFDKGDVKEFIRAAGFTVSEE